MYILLTATLRTSHKGYLGTWDIWYNLIFIFRNLNKNRSQSYYASYFTVTIKPFIITLDYLLEETTQDVPTDSILARCLQILSLYMLLINVIQLFVKYSHCIDLERIL